MSENQSRHPSGCDCPPCRLWTTSKAEPQREARSAPPLGADLTCKLVGADTSDDTITLQLPPGLRPCGLVIGEMMTINRICPNDPSSATPD